MTETTHYTKHSTCTVMVVKLAGIREIVDPLGYGLLCHVSY